MHRLRGQARERAQASDNLVGVHLAQSPSQGKKKRFWVRALGAGPGVPWPSCAMFLNFSSSSKVVDDFCGGAFFHHHSVLHRPRSRSRVSRSRWLVLVLVRLRLLRPRERL